MSIFALAVERGPSDLRLFWRIVRSAAGHVSCVEAAAFWGKAQKGATPRATWRPEGYLRGVGGDGIRFRGRTPALEALSGSALLMAAPASRALAALPRCDQDAYDEVLVLGRRLVDDITERQEIRAELWPAGTVVAAASNESWRALWTLEDAAPWIAISLVDIAPDAA